MEIKKIIKESESIKALIKDKRLFDVFERMHTLCQAINKWQLLDDLKRLEDTYKYMIHYWSEGFNDEHRDEMFENLKEDLYRLTDAIEFELRLTDDYSIFFEQRRIFNSSPKSLTTLLSDYYSIKNKYDVMIESSEYNKSVAENMESVINGIFNYVWLTPHLSSEDAAVIKQLLQDESVAENLKNLITSALLLGSLSYYDNKKLILLIDDYINLHRQQSIVAMIFILSAHSNRILNDNNIKSRIGLISEQPVFIEDLKHVVLNIIKTRDTERINKKMRDEVFPEIMKLQPKIIDRFKDVGKDLDVNIMEENPEWQDMLDKSGISDKLKEISEMQSDGADVMMIAFSNLKNFAFFTKVSNWFLPFDINHSHLSELHQISNENLMAIVGNDSMMCDSDRYSFALSIAKMPVQQRNILIQQMDAQLSHFNEEKRASLKLSLQDNKTHGITKYIRDIYRFFKLYTRRNDFKDPFASPLNIVELPFISDILKNQELIELVAEFYFTRGYYSDALKLFLTLESIIISDDNIYQKIAYCYQCNKNIFGALEYYKKAEIISADNLWLIKMIANCNKNIQNYEEAIKYYRKAIELDSENLSLIMNLGHCLLENDEVEEALRCYYKVEYLDENGSKALRPIAWCEFILGHYEKSHNYYLKILSDNPTQSDYLNIGHLNLVEGNINDAIYHYVKSAIESEKGVNGFMKSFDADTPQLIKLGIKSCDIPLIKDKIHYDLKA